MTYPVCAYIEDSTTISNEEQDVKMEFDLVQEIDPHSGRMVDIIVLDVSSEHFTVLNTENDKSHGFQ